MVGPGLMKSVVCAVDWGKAAGDRCEDCLPLGAQDPEGQNAYQVPTFKLLNLDLSLQTVRLFLSGHKEPCILLARISLPAYITTHPSVHMHDQTIGKNLKARQELDHCLLLSSQRKSLYTSIQAWVL